MTVADGLSLMLGLALFLFGMNLMGEALKHRAGGQFQRLLRKMTNGRLRSCLLGLSVTAIIQSSSATTVMAVGLVHAGTIVLSQAVGVIVGANVGTAVTAWLTALSGLEGGHAAGNLLQWLKPSSFTPILALTGLLLTMMIKNEKRKHTGRILLGFSVLMLGMDTMSEAVSGLAKSESFRAVLVAFRNPLLGLLTGMLMTAVLQSSSASVGILQSLTVTGAVSLGTAIPIILGQNIGTCITAVLASVGTSRDARRVACFHVLFNAVGSVIWLVAFALLQYGWHLPLLSRPADMWDIAGVHTLLKLLTVAVLFPFLSILERWTACLVRDKQPRSTAVAPLDARLLATPSVALAQSRRQTVVMATGAMEALCAACTLTEHFDRGRAEEIRVAEREADAWESRIGTDLLRIAAQPLTDAEGRLVDRLLHLPGELERIADHAVKLTESAEELDEKQLPLSEQARADLRVLCSAMQELTEVTLACIKQDAPTQAARAEQLKQVIDDLCVRIRHRHIQRLQSGRCTWEAGFVLNDMLTDLKRSADHCANLASAWYASDHTGRITEERPSRTETSDGARQGAQQDALADRYRLEGEP